MKEYIEQKNQRNENFVRNYQNLISNELCDEIIRKFEEDERKEAGQTAGGYNPEMKSSMDLSSSYDDWLREKELLKEGLNKAFNLYKNEFITAFDQLKSRRIYDTGYLLRRYEKGSGFFDLHIDSQGLDRSCRFLTVIFYFNDVEEGGETEFVDLGIKIKPQRGSITIFPPYFTHLHKGHVPLSDSKYIATSFLCLMD